MAAIAKQLFEQSVNFEFQRAAADSSNYTYCDVCSIPMNMTSGGLECPQCFVVKRICGSLQDCTDDSTGVIKYSMDGRCMFTSIPDNTRSQKKQILDQLLKLNDRYQHSGARPIPKNIIEKTAQNYNDIQKITIDVYENGKIIGTKKFVKRGNIKDETLGACLYYACIESGVARREKDIAEFMCLLSNGISRG